jgi:hypothetical protein
LVYQDNVSVLVNLPECKSNHWPHIFGCLPGAARQYQQRIGLGNLTDGWDDCEVDFDLPAGIFGTIFKYCMRAAQYFLAVIGYMAG